MGEGRQLMTLPRFIGEPREGEDKGSVAREDLPVCICASVPSIRTMCVRT